MPLPDKRLIKLNRKMFRNPFVPEDDQFNGVNGVDIFDGINSSDVINGVNSNNSNSSGSIVFERIGSYDDSISSNSASPCTTAEVVETTDKITCFGQKSANNLMLLSLLEHLCTLYVDDDETGRQLFELLCKKLHCMKLIQNFGTLDDVKAIRQKYQAAFVNMMSAALETVKNNGNVNSLNPEKLWHMTTEQNVTSLSLHSWYKDMFHEEKLIAFGGFGEVCKAKNKLDQKCYAIKKVKLIESQPEICQKTLREVQVFSNLNHSNIVRYHSSWLEYGLTEFTGSKKDVSEKKDSEIQINTASAAGELFSLDLLGSHFGNFNVGLLKNRKLSQKYISYEKDIEVFNGETSDKNLKQSDDDCSTIYSESPPKDDKKPGRKRNNSLGRSLSSGDVPIHHTQMEEVNYCRGKFYDSNLRKALNMTLFIQMELCQLTLRSWIDDRNSKIQKSSEIFRLINIRIFKQITLAIRYIHSEALIHRDIKPENIFISFQDESNFVVKVGDFGLARDDNLPKTPTSELDVPICCYAFQPSLLVHTEGVGTAVYAAPEQKSSSNYTNKVDIFSIGIILFELFRLFTTDMERLKAIQDLLNVPTCGDIEQIWIDECKLIRQMAVRDPNKRPSADSILSLIADHFDIDTVDQLKSKLSQQEVEITRLRSLLKKTESKVCIQCQLLCTHQKHENKQSFE